MERLKINKPCPKCNKVNSIFVNSNFIQCNNCNYEIKYCCPLCNSSLENSKFTKNENGEYYECSSCKNDIHITKIQNLINNMMQVSHDKRCKLCNGPTVYRTQANIGHRCFYFPKCFGQSSLFAPKKECLIFLDFETSGLEPGKNHIIEIGALKIDSDGFEHTFDSFVKPPVSLTEKITQITKITDEMLTNAPTIDEIIYDFYEFIGDATIIAHNAEFDTTWMILEFMKHDLKLQNNSIVCTFKWAQLMNESRCSLSALTKKYKIGHLNAHRALADAAVTKELFFIYEDAQLISRPVKPISDYMKIVNKIKSVQLKNKIPVKTGS
tara:strand:- start:961 stop:1935 length:975 start_codon:yes stop_codon:yes gene_type:complete